MSIYAIDFGYSKACIATTDKEGTPYIINNYHDGKEQLDCAVFFDSNDQAIFGSNARDMWEIESERVVQFVKYKLNNYNDEIYKINGKKYTPVDITGLIFKQLKQMVEEQGDFINDVVVAMPAYFGGEERRAMMQATEMAGLNLVGAICEQTAVVLAYLHNEATTNKTILVYDLGSSTFDVSVLKETSDADMKQRGVAPFKILATDGDYWFGGSNWDDKLYDFILQTCCDENGLLPDEIDIETCRIIRSKAENAKKKISYSEKVMIKVNVNGSMTKISISREDFEKLTEDLVERTLKYVDNVLQRGAISHIDEVLLSGGSTYMPMIQNALEKKFPGKVRCENPDSVIARGAAIYARYLEFYVE